MTTWHPTIIAYEVWPSKRQGLSPQGANASVTVWLPTSSDLDEFLEYLIVDRPPRVLGEDQLDTFVFRPVNAVGRPIDGCYTTDGDQQVTTSSSGWLVDITYANCIQSEATIFQQNVLVTERITQQTEFLKLDYNQFYWDIASEVGSGTSTCSGYKPLRSPDETPGIAFKSYKVDTIIERLNIDQDDVATALDAMSGTTNDNPVRFYTWQGTRNAETVMVNVNNLERAVERFSLDYGSGSESDYYWWWTVSLTFNVRPQGWNTFWRIDETGANGYEWTRLRIKGAQSCDLFYPYPMASHISSFLTLSV